MIVPVAATSDDTASDYAWLFSEERPGAWMCEAACFTFVNGVGPGELVAEHLPEAEQRDLTGDPDAAEEFISPEMGQDTAVFDAGDDWTVIYQNNGVPEQVATKVLSSPNVKAGVMVFWNVNSLTEFGYWEHGQRVVGFALPDERYGTDPDRLLADIRAVGMNTDSLDDDADSGPLVVMLQLADRLTGRHLEQDFLARPLWAALVDDPDF